MGTKLSYTPSKTMTHQFGRQLLINIIILRKSTTNKLPQQWHERFTEMLTTLDTQFRRQYIHAHDGNTVIGNFVGYLLGIWIVGEEGFVNGGCLF